MTATADAEIDLALARSVVYHTLALGLARPSRESVNTLASEEARGALQAAARLLDAYGSDVPALAPTVAALLAQIAGTLGERRRDYNRLFGHASAPVPPFETEYDAGGGHGQPQRLADIAGYYLAFGLRPAARLDERVDHVACQCEFMGFLARKQAFLLSAPRETEDHVEQLALVRTAFRSFFRDHLGRFGRAYVVRLAHVAAEGFYAELAQVALRAFEREAERLRVALGPATLELAPQLVDPAPMACGVADDPTLPR